MSKEMRKMIDKIKSFKNIINEGEINWEKEKSWKIKD
jgi:hypothetical protein